MDPQMQQFMMIAAVVILVRVILAIIATKRGGWGWWPWGVIALEITLEIMLPGLEALISVSALITLIVMCVKKRQPAKEAT